MALHYRKICTKAMLAIALAALHSPAIAQHSSNFGVVSISSSSAEPIRGHTQGFVPLSSLVLRDDHGNTCVGYAETEPDHVLQVTESLGAIALRVNSNGGDTTLLVQGDDGRTWCGDDFQGTTDARIRIGNFTEGTYQVWVGSFDAGVRYQYSIQIQ